MDGRKGKSMNTRAITLFAGLLAVMLSAATVTAETFEEELVRLRAENDMLQSKIKSLKAELTLLKADIKEMKQQLSRAKLATTQPAKPTVNSASQDATQNKKLAPKGLIECDERWWTDVNLFIKQIELRKKLPKAMQKDEGIIAWLVRNNSFAGKKVKWRLPVKYSRPLTPAYLKARTKEAKAAIKREQEKKTKYEKVLSRRAAPKKELSRLRKILESMKASAKRRGASKLFGRKISEVDIYVLCDWEFQRAKKNLSVRRAQLKAMEAATKAGGGVLYQYLLTRGFVQKPGPPQGVNFFAFCPGQAKAPLIKSRPYEWEGELQGWVEYLMRMEGHDAVLLVGTCKYVKQNIRKPPRL